MSKVFCSKCANKLSGENKNFKDESKLDNSSIPSLIHEQSTENIRQPPRTSTPIQGLENNPPTNFSDSVNEFFYQSWKCGLNSNGPANNQQQQGYQLPQPTTIVHTLPNVTQVLFLNTWVVQPLVTPNFQQVGILPDGTAVLLQTYVPCNGYLV